MAAGAERANVHGQARIERPRLLARVRAGLESGSLLLNAGPGYGKTVLLEQALSEPEGATAWIGCADADRDPPRLLLRLARAVSAAVPGAGDPLAEQLAATTGPIDAEAAAADLLADLNRILVEPIFIVLDDAERLDGAPGALDLISVLLRTGSTLVRTAVATRRRLDLRIAKPRATGRLTELSAADLAFTAEESAELAARLRGTPLGQLELERLVAATEGWPLGVALLAIAPGGRPEREGALDDREAELINSYLAEELLESLDQDLREAVVDASVPSRLTPAIVAALDLPDDTLERIERAGIPVRRLGSEAPTIVLHPLLRELLQRRLVDSGGEERRRALHARVAPAMATAGEPLEAVEHWLEAGAWAELVSYLSREGQELARTSPGSVRAAVSRLPPEAAADPGIQLLDGQLRWGAGDHPGAAPVLAAAAAGLRERGDSSREWMARLMLFDALGSGGDFEGAMASLHGLEEPATQTAGPFAPATARFAAMALVTFGRFEESERIEALAAGHPDADATISLEAVRLAVIEYLSGDLDDAARRLRAATRDTRPDPLNLRYYAWQSMTRILDDAGRSDEAIAAWRTVEGELGSALAPYAARESHDVQAKLHARAGRLAEAEAELARAGAIERGWRAQSRDLATAWIGALKGDGQAVAAAADRALELQPTAPCVVQAETAIDLIPPLATTGGRDRAIAVLEDTVAMLDASFSGAAARYPTAYLLGIRAWLHDAVGDRDAADHDLRRMWERAGEARRFIIRREWPRLGPLVWGALERGRIDAGQAVAAVTTAADGAPLTALTDHPAAAVRRAAIPRAVASGDPAAVRRLEGLTEDADAGVARAARAARAALPAAAPALRFRLLGDFRVERGTWSISEQYWERPSAAKLVRFLLVHGSEPLPADAIVEALWHSLPPDRGRGSLQVAVSRARRALDLPGTKPSVLESVDGAYRLRLADRDRVDAEEFERAAGTALAESGDKRRELLERARALWGGQPLPAERYEEWTRAWRERLIDRYVGVLGELTVVYGRRGEHQDAIAAARELIELDPLNEGAHRELMAAYARAGRTGQALHQYLECRRNLVGELGIEPAEATSRLQARILAGEPV